MCFPSTCSAQDVEEIANHVMSNGELNVTSATCTSTDPISFNIRIIAVAIFAILILVVLVSTAYDLNMKIEESEWSMTADYNRYYDTKNHSRVAPFNGRRLFYSSQWKCSFRCITRRPIPNSRMHWWHPCDCITLDHLWPPTTRHVHCTSD